MNWAKKITRIVPLIFLALSLASCDTGCYEADEFDTESVIIKAKPTTDGIYGTYDAATGGQRAAWHATGLKSNGQPFVIKISGSWSPWLGSDMNATKMKDLHPCKFCAKKNGVPNCICYDGIDPEPEKCPNGSNCTTYIDSTVTPAVSHTLDCTNHLHQDDPSVCTCTNKPAYGDALQYPVYHIPLNIQHKDETYSLADQQSQCKYDRGMGAYVALFGPSGTTMPTRIYHLFSQTEACDVVRSGINNAQCLDANGDDVTSYVFTSANNRIFMKDDHHGNDGTDTDTSDDEYHTPNEEVKFIIYDNYYSDNYGQYNIKILKGVGNANDSGLLEFLVSTVENVILGEIGDDGQRQGGIIEFMYKAIVQDSGFILILQVCLGLYVSLYGAAYLFGVAEINKKELMSRTLKIALVVFFTSADSWSFYNQIVVGFFKDGTDSIIAMMMDLSDKNIDPTSDIKIAQMDRANNISNATRFSYVDLTLKKLFSLPVAEKIFGLFFTNLFGFLYIPIIYGLIGFFTYVMLHVGSLYLVNVLKIIFVLSLGPIFICFTLFSKTVGMFRNWVGFLGGRSLEIIMLFSVLYNFLLLIDKNFTQLLSYRVCVINEGIGLVSMNVAHSYVNREFMVWMISFAKLGGLIFIMYLVIGKVSSLSSALFTIKIAGGEAKGGSSGAGMAGKMMSGMMDLGKGAAGILGEGAKAAGFYAGKGIAAASRASGLSAKIDKIGDSIGFRNPRTMYRDGIIDGAIGKAQAKGRAAGKTGAELDKFVRGEAVKDLQAQMHKNPREMAMAGVSMNTIAKRMDDKLIKAPLKDFLKGEAKKLKNSANPPLGKDMKEALQKSAREWAKNSSDPNAGSKIEGYLGRKGMNELMRKEGQMNSSEAAKQFAHDDEGKNKFLQHLEDNKFERRKAKEDAKAKGKFSQFSNWVGRGVDNLKRNAADNPKLMQENFARKVDYEENKGNGVFNEKKGLNPLKRINFFDKAANRQERGEMVDNMRKATLAGELEKGNGIKAPKAADQMTKDEREKAARENRKRDYMQNEMRKLATKDLAQDVKDLRKLEKGGDKDKVKADALKQGMFGKLEKDLKDPNKTAFEKAERLAYLQNQFGKKDGREDIDKAMKKDAEKRREELKAKPLDDKGKKALDGLRKDAFGKETGKETDAALQKGLQDLKDSNPKLADDDKAAKTAREAADKAANERANERHLEAKNKADALEKEMKLQADLAAIAKGGASPELIAAAKKELAAPNNEVVAGAAALEKKIVDKVDKFEKVEINVGNVNEAKASLLDAKGFTPAGVKTDFGSISDAMMKAPNPGLKAGNPLLGVPDAQPGQVDHGAMNALSMDKNQSSGKLKMDKLDQKIKKFELEGLAADDFKGRAALQKEIDELDAQIAKGEKHLQEVDANIAKVSAGG